MEDLLKYKKCQLSDFEEMLDYLEEQYQERSTTEPRHSGIIYLEKEIEKHKRIVKHIRNLKE